MSKSSKTKSGRKATETLTDDAIVTSPKMKRRKLLTIAGHGVVGAAAVVTGLSSTPSHALTDADTGRYADPVRGGRGSGYTDSDTGRYADPAGGGGTGATDADTGRYADPAGNGRRQQRRQRHSDSVDSDTGRYADPADSD